MVLLGAELIRRYLVHAENESLRCRVAGVIFYGSLKGGTMAAIRLHFISASARNSRRYQSQSFKGLAETINFVFQFWVVFVAAKSGLQLTAGSA